MARRFAALDTDFLIGIRDGVEDCLTVADWLSQSNLHPLVSETVLHELADIKRLDPSPDVRNMAHEILSSLSVWNFLTPPLSSMQRGIAEQVANKILACGCLGDDPLLNEGLIIAEAALLECTMIVSNSKSMGNASADHLKLVLLESDVCDLFVVSTNEVIEYLNSKK